MSFRFPLATSSWDQRELDALQRVIDSNQYSMGSEVAAFEREFAANFGAAHAIMVNSGSSANLIMTAALAYTKNPRLKIFPGDEIIVPAVSWPTTYYPLSQYGLKLKFVDIDLHSLNYDLVALENAVNDETRAIMVVNLLGNPNDFDAIDQIIAGREIVVVEDNCESMGATFKGKQAGTFGVMGSYSCFFSHHISTMEGGMVVTDDEEIYHIMLALRAHGWTRNLPKFNQITGEKSDDPFEESFRFVLPGYNLRPLEMSGAVGSEQLKKLPNLLSGRRSNADLFKKHFLDHPTVAMQRETGESSWFGFSLIIKPEVSLERTELVKRLALAGFECRPMVGGNFAKHEAMRYLNHTVFGHLKNAEYIDNRGLFVGNHHYPMEEAITELATLIKGL